jgi:hypothetical protein
MLIRTQSQFIERLVTKVKKKIEVNEKLRRKLAAYKSIIRYYNILANFV